MPHHLMELAVALLNIEYGQKEYHRNEISEATRKACIVVVYRQSYCAHRVVWEGELASSKSIKTSCQNHLTSLSISHASIIFINYYHFILESQDYHRVCWKNILKIC